MPLLSRLCGDLTGNRIETPIITFSVAFQKSFNLVGCCHNYISFLLF